MEKEVLSNQYEDCLYSLGIRTKTEKEILELNDPNISFLYCMDNKNANIKLHEDIIVHNKNVSCAYYFALNIPGANVERLQEIVITYGSIGKIYLFAKYVKESNKEKLFKAILKTGHIEAINKFIQDIPISEELKELIIFI